MKRLFGTAGIRGRYLKHITPELAYELGLSLATYLKAGKIAVGGDGRLTTPLLKLASSVGIMAAGCNVIDMGLIPLPTLAWSVKRFKCDGGLYVTASHNPPTDNGLKVFTNEGMEFTEQMEKDIEALIASRSWRFADWNLVGTRVETNDVIKDYVEELVTKLLPHQQKLKPKILVDTANGAPSLTTPKILKSIGADVISLNSNIDGRFPGRLPEPRPDILKPFIPVAKDLGVDVFFAQDGDGDRLAVIEPSYGFVKQDRIIALIAKYKLMERKGTIVISIDVGNSVRDVVNEFGGKVAVVKLGKTHEGLIRYSNAIMAAEPWKLIDPEWGKWIDGAYQAAYLTKIMMEEGKSMKDLLSDLPNYPQARYSLRIREELKEDVYRVLVNRIKQLMKGKEKVLEIDGFRVDFPDDSWVLVRKSGTEPKVRIYGEAKTPKELKRIVDDLIKVANSYVRSKGMEKLEVEGEIIP